jgi:hypothetical protein
MALYNSCDLPNVYKQQGVVAKAFAEATILNHGKLWLNRKTVMGSRIQPIAQWQRRKLTSENLKMCNFSIFDTSADLKGKEKCMQHLKFR